MDAIAMAVHAKTTHQKQLKLDRFKKETKWETADSTKSKKINWALL
jgi:hypothetical protein